MDLTSHDHHEASHDAGKSKGKSKDAKRQNIIVAGTILGVLIAYLTYRRMKNGSGGAAATPAATGTAFTPTDTSGGGTASQPTTGTDTSGLTDILGTISTDLENLTGQIGTLPTLGDIASIGTTSGTTETGTATTPTPVAGTGAVPTTPSPPGSDTSGSAPAPSAPNLLSAAYARLSKALGGHPVDMAYLSGISGHPADAAWVEGIGSSDVAAQHFVASLKHPTAPTSTHKTITPAHPAQKSK